ncbi:NifU family protein [Buchnera aphidicola]|uniref:NifU family protein n=1 Tax=Buchnera aphidicola TaxID=9 RepID=UPI003464DDE4
MIYISKNAHEYIKKILSHDIKKKYIELYVDIKQKKINFKMLFIKNFLKVQYFKIEFKGFNIYIKKNNLKFVYNLEIDLLQNNLTQKLIFKISNNKLKKQKNFNINSSKKYSILENRVKQFINIHINPILMSHGGELFLEKINDKKQLFIKFFGNCHSCVMVKTTFNQMIQKKLSLAFPELTEIVDVTDHNNKI